MLWEENYVNYFTFGNVILEEYIEEKEKTVWGNEMS